MKSNLKNTFKFLFLIGLILLFTSLFLDWYTFLAYDSNHNIIASWSYNPFTEWTSPLPKNDDVNKELRPRKLSIPIAINVIFIIAILASAYSVLFKDFEREKDFEKLRAYAYINFFLLLLNGYYLFAFPIFYLIPRGLYFPFLTVEHEESELIYYYSIGPGYVLQLLSFVLIFPYALFYYKTVESFKMEAHTPKKVLGRYLQKVQEPLDLDKYIAEEELKLKFDDYSSEDSEGIRFNKPKTQRRIIS